jgi:hypothetical protein
MAGITTTRVLSGARSQAAAGPLWFLALLVDLIRLQAVCDAHLIEVSVASKR